MQGKKEFNQRIYYNINLDSLVPQDHFLKRVQKLISFDFVRDITRSYYSHTGKPSIDPMVLVKMLLIGYFLTLDQKESLPRKYPLTSPTACISDMTLMKKYQTTVSFPKPE